MMRETHRSWLKAYVACCLLCLTVGVKAQEAPPRALPVEAAPAAPAEAAPDFSGPGRVISSSEQFRVSGGDGSFRGSVAILAEEAKSDLLAVLEEKDNWRVKGRVPISIILHGQQGDPVPPRTLATRLIYSEAGYELIIDLHLSRGIEQDALKRTVTGALIYERALRGKTPSSEDTGLVLPQWLVEGLREASAWGQGGGDRRLYEGLFKNGGLFKMDQLFAVNDQSYATMDAATRAAYRVSSGALVMALLEQPQGKQGFRSFLTEVAAFDGEMPSLLRKHFPELNLSETSLAKWWALQLANKGTAPLADVLPIDKTEQILAETLKLTLRSPEGVNEQKDISSSWQELAPLTIAEREAAVRIAQDGLIRLSYRSFPSYRPMLAEYQLILTALIMNQTANMATRLAELEETRVAYVAQAKRGSDFLDWFEITRARDTSGAFDDYLRLKEQLKNQPNQRRDALSLYLDKLDVLFDRGPEVTKPADGPPPAEPPLADPNAPEPPLILPE